ncbi:hypothetical protein F4780DRAFT_22121 [Xylariomycetidae sp. FL0641]|nr:hypothetical protein F4780DRAFT_22121 [Xylariomycetidae sp. FL0641]
MSNNYDNEAPAGQGIADDSYVSRPGHKHEAIPVTSDAERVADPVDGATADSDAQLERDDKDAIDESNIVPERTRGARPGAGAYAEPGDEEGLPADDGTSSADVKVPEN